MTMIEPLIQELEQEAATTRRVLERVPNDRLAWKPHDKSMSLGQLALHMATVPGAIAEISRDLAVPGSDVQQPSANERRGTDPGARREHLRARKRCSALGDAASANVAADGRRQGSDGGSGGGVPTLMLNHWYHHRGQLSVYLRQVGVPVPSIYGPSADENPFLARAEAVPTA